MKTAPLLEAYDWEQLERVIILSPHLDNAALSCGGLLAALPPPVPRTVVTLCCGNPVPRAPEAVLETQGKHAQRGRNRKGFATPEERRTEIAPRWPRSTRTASSWASRTPSIAGAR